MTATPALTFNEDEAVREHQDAGKAVWVAGLSDGSRVFQDDFRNGGRAWLRLSQHLLANGLSISSLRLKFRSEWLSPAPDNCPGYYFSLGVGGMMGGPSEEFYAVGWLEGGRLRVRRVRVPELTVFHEEDREVPANDPRLILAHGTPQDRAGLLH